MSNSESKNKVTRILLALPTHNNAETLEGVLCESMRHMPHICVVNDGCTDATPEILSRINTGENGLVVLTHPVRKGKGAALLTAFEYAKANGFDTVVTMDTDGQHFANDLPAFVEACLAFPDEIVIGDRGLLSKPIANAPNSSVFGCKFSNFWVWLETGSKLSDTQSGFRAYPVRLIPIRSLSRTSYDFEIEVLVKSLWRGVAARSVSIGVFYPPRGQRVSHFKPWLDNGRLTLLHTKLVTRRLVALSFAQLGLSPNRFMKALAARRA